MNLKPYHKYKDSGGIFEDIRELITTARSMVVRNVNTLQVLTNFEIGRRIVSEEQKGSVRAEYGKQIITELSRQLTTEFGRGFSRSNLEYMRKFYQIYQARVSGISQMPSGKSESSQNLQVINEKMVQSFLLSWSQYVFLIGIKDADARRFYEIEAAENSWTLPELTRQFNSGLYERLALSRDKEGILKLAREGHVISKPQDMLKNPYVLEFLGLDEKSRYSESDLETAIIDKLEHFLLELGKGFLFEARQKKRDAMVKITLPADANIHAKEYQLYLPSKEELRQKLIDWTTETEDDYES